MNVAPAGATSAPRRTQRAPSAVPPPAGTAPPHPHPLPPDIEGTDPEGDPVGGPQRDAAPAPGDTSAARSLAARLIARWFHDPVQFAWDAFGVRLWRRQRQILRAAAREYAHGKTFRIAVRSGHKCGKSMVIAVLALWWATTRARARVVMTAPSARQIRSILWREIQTLFRRARFRLAALGGLGGRLYEVPDAGLQFDDQSEVVGFSTNQPERMAGTSGENLLYLIDEASGVDRRIWEAIEGNRAGEASVCMFSNPTQTSGYFYDAFHENAGLWIRFHISSEETPNFRANRKVIPGLAQRSWVEEKQREWGPDWENDPRYQVRVRGEFPRSSNNQVISLDDVHAAKFRYFRFAARVLGRTKYLPNPDDWPKIIRTKGDLERVRAVYHDHHEPLQIGVDPAWYGNDLSVIFLRRGERMFAPLVLQRVNGEVVAERVRDAVLAFRRRNEKPRVLIDMIGIGVEAYGYLRKMRDILVLIGVNTSIPSTEDNEYKNLRTEIAFSTKKWLRGGDAMANGKRRPPGMFEPAAVLEAELVAPLYSFVGSTGEVEVEPKKLVKQRLGRSPDFGDAFGLAAFEGAIRHRRILPLPTFKHPSSGLRFGQLTGKGFG
jgi:hypothetical protein